ncbi:MAG TPA: hypothetical protein VFQ44_00555 [Streptosporangiaceae bacterium]|nr:hypothetical protein [Streptosporangiaceae bacterium]
MPWQSLELPSLPIGLLRTVAVEAGFPAPVTYHGSLRWAEYLIEVTGDEIGVAALAEYAAGQHVDTAVITRMREHAAGFVALAAAEILKCDASGGAAWSALLSGELSRLMASVRSVFGPIRAAVVPSDG